MRNVHSVAWCAFRSLRKIAKSDYWLGHVRLSVRPSARNNSAPTGRISMRFYV